MNERVPAAKYAVGHDLSDELEIWPYPYAKILDTRPELSMQKFRVDDP
jgi:hypothetical protein